jgi:predicted  nucleic acid-binding Zn-ribbon protein
MRSLLQHAPCGVVLTFLGLLAGCTSGRLLEVKEREIDELRFLNAKKNESLSTALGHSVLLTERLSSLEVEKASLLAELAGLQAEAKRDKQSLEALEREQAQLQEKLDGVEKALEKLKRTHAQVKTVASSTAGELADLRLRKQELEERAESLNQTNGSLREQNATLAREFEQLRADLVRERAVVRSLQGGAGPGERVEGLERQLRGLEEEHKKLRGENVVLLQQVQALRAQLGESGPGATASEGQGGDFAPLTTAASLRLYREDPRGLWVEAVGLVGSRLAKARRGDVAWDGVDLLLIGGGAAGLLTAIWLALAPVRWRRRRRLKQELELAQRRVRDLESREAQDSSDAPPARRRSERRSSVVRRPGQFSPIISGESPRVAATAPAAAPPAAPAADDELEEIVTVNLGGGDSRTVPIDPLGAGRAFPAIDESAVTEALGIRKRHPRQLVERGGAAPAKEALADDDTAEIEDAGEDEAGELEDEFANTQIIPRLSELEDLASRERRKGVETAPKQASPKPLSKAAAPPRDDREFLAELKEIIGQKVDELIR